MVAYLRCYVAASLVGHVIWEIAHLPLYAIWRTGTPLAIAWAVVHCTGGDLVIAVSALAAGLVLRPAPSAGRANIFHPAVIAIAITGGVVYTGYSEWLNTAVRKSWAYAPLMPVLPGLGIGVSPLLQWVVVPALAFWWVARRAPAAPGSGVPAGTASGPPGSAVPARGDTLARAELLSAVGAGVLGGGLALLFRRALEPHAPAITLVGLAMHSWGMYWRRRLDRQAGAGRARWEEIAYWLCWAALLVLAVYMAIWR
jgi:hypothetical protein